MRLSKSRYCRGLQCPKQLWMDINKPEEAIEDDKTAIFETGDKIGDLARGYFGEYELVDYEIDKSIMVNKTKELMAKGVKNIAEASFIYDDGFCAVDVLHRNDNGTYDIVEVKSSSRLKDVYKNDMTYQYYLLKNNGVKINRVYLMNVNNEYFRGEELDIHEFFNLNDCTAEVLERAKSIEDNLKYIKSLATGNDEPNLKMSENCESPYKCPYMQYCFGRDIERNSILSLKGNGLRKADKYKLINEGVKSYEDMIKNGVKLNNSQRQQVEMEVYDKEPMVNKEKIRQFLDTVKYPLYNLDFETMMPAIPEFVNTRPFENIPFQYSLHIVKEKDGEVIHKEFLAKEGTDPRRALAKRLCEDIPRGVHSIAFNMSFEKGVILRLAEMFPDLRDHLMDIRDNMIDLMVVFKNRDYYSKEMEGSYSIKKVLPAMCPDDPELDYHNLDGVHNGTEALTIFPQIQYMNKEDAKEARKNLLAYCRLDTLAMVKILEKLYDIVGE